MSAAKDVSAKRVALNLRTEPDEQAVTEETLIEQPIIMTGSEAYQEFLARLDQPPAPNAALCKTMQTPAPWEQKK
ncbi:type II toxin-antitoxin system TacA family antitoxin [Pectobacterium brasiliense]|uniref:type II toxin-antitoxin system TacA family antitoxin n=1 Tax=Pectobacterium brasiliense TaxID=180957 RepID=UPI0039873725